MVDIFTLLLLPVPGSVSASTSGPGPGGGNGPGPGPGGGGGTSTGPPSDMSSIFPEMQQSFSKEVKPMCLCNDRSGGLCCGKTDLCDRALAAYNHVQKNKKREEKNSIAQNSLRHAQSGIMTNIKS